VAVAVATGLDGRSRKSSVDTRSQPSGRIDHRLLGVSGQALRAELLGGDSLVAPGLSAAREAAANARQTSDGPSEIPRSGIRRPVEPPQLSPARSMLRFSHTENSNPASPRTATVDVVRSHASHALSPLTKSVISAPSASWRRIPKVPYKVLDAPSLVNDYYLNLIDWSAKDVLAVGLGERVYLWNARDSTVTQLVELGKGDNIASVSWSMSGKRLAVGSTHGEVSVMDAETCKSVRTFRGHRGRVGALSWQSHLLATGGKDGTIFLRDVRVREESVQTLSDHAAEVCGLRWSPDGGVLASGGNDNLVMLWSTGGTARGADGAGLAPLYRLQGHRAAVKAMDWSPHRDGLLATGGGTQDKCVRFWSSTTGKCLGCVDTGSQVCNVRWSLSCEELVTSHGYSQNHIAVWKYPSMTRVATLTGHTYRVLFMAMDPSGERIVTGAGDETLRFWSVFPPMSTAQREAAASTASATLVTSPSVRGRRGSRRGGGHTSSGLSSIEEVVASPMLGDDTIR
jgi:cell division cycle 20-like protein 1, cofactor of APC complex